MIYKMSSLDYIKGCTKVSACPPSVTHDPSVDFTLYSYHGGKRYILDDTPMDKPLLDAWGNGPPSYILSWQHRTQRDPRPALDLFDVFPYAYYMWACSPSFADRWKDLLGSQIEILPIHIYHKPMALIRVLRVVRTDAVDPARSEIIQMFGSDRYVRVQFRKGTVPDDKPCVFILTVGESLGEGNHQYLYFNQPMKDAIDSWGGCRGGLIIPADESSPWDQSDSDCLRESEERRRLEALRPPEIEEEPESVISALRRRAPRGLKRLGKPGRDSLLELLDQRLYDMQAQWADDKDRYGLCEEIQDYTAMLGVLCMDELNARPVRHRQQGMRQWRKGAFLLPDQRTLVCAKELLHRTVEEDCEPSVALTLTLIASEPEPNPDDPNDPGHDTHIIYIR